MQHLKMNLRSLLAGLTSVFLLALVAGASAAERRTGSSFDHFTTGFPLTGAHAQTECQTCHLQGVFKGTPRQCEVCHTQGSRIASTFKPISHPRTAVACNQCHNSQTTWTGARYDHVGVAQHSCIMCHNGDTATGKPTTGMHPTTADPCDNCHRTTAWLPAMWDHTGVLQGTCASLCHNGTKAMGKNPSHIPDSFIAAGWSCDACHSSTATTFTFTTFNRNTHYTAPHSVLPNDCTSCHNGSYTSANAQGKNAKHIPTTKATPDDCDVCHNAPQFKPAQFSHDSTHGVIAGDCNSCHVGGYNGTQTKPGDHPNVGTTSCDNAGCHTTSTFAMRVPLPTLPQRAPLPGRVPLPRK